MKMVVSFGFRHGDNPNSADATVIDVRTLFPKNPYHNKALRYLRGTDPEVQEEIRNTPGFDVAYQKLTKKVAESPHEIIWLGCTGGHHRSVYAAELISQQFGYAVLHRDIDKK
jgi:UPF0042 nucleotide-binding protein